MPDKTNIPGTEEGSLYSAALAFATLKHGMQIRRDGTPYIKHPVRVAEVLKEQGYDIRYQIVALLHDVLEDTDATEEELKDFCDEEMLEAVRLLTKTEGVSSKTYIARILNNGIAKAVKNADRICNLRDALTCGDEGFRRRYLKNTTDYYCRKFSEELDECARDLEAALHMPSATEKS